METQRTLGADAPSVLKRLLSKIRGPIWCLLTLIWIASTLDYFEHIGRPDQEFRVYWIGWLAFTAASTIGVTTVLLTGHLLGPRRGIARFAIDVITVVIVPAVHVWVAGPIFNKIFYPQSPLHFTSPWGLSKVLAIAFIFICVVWWGIASLLARRASK